MFSIQYIGEHLFPGQLGHFAILLSFVSSLLAAGAFFMATRQRQDAELALGWRRIGRISFGIHGISVFTVIAVLFYVMVNQYYEYHYAWSHVNEDLDFKYIFSAFWEGQEGSFLLWMFWHVVLGWLLIFSAGEWESPVLSTISLAQAVIGSMILGIYVGFGEEAVRIGSNPTLLLRDVMDAPIFSNPEYLSLIQGNGLNPLLQNYWMTIHPPVLFLGFASTIIPFGYAMGGLITGDHTGWLRPVLPWALFSGAMLGTGILMGGAWAYEALSFGGYWAWDPVENMSLVPWLLLLAGIHSNLIANSTNHSIRASYLFYLLSFIMILYSTFLTRSGVLGETSVHSFTEMGLGNQLILLIAIFVLLGFVPFLWQYKRIPAPEKEEATGSKEFWMFIGALVLLFSSAMITASTSLPVYNKIREFFDPAFIGQVINDQEAHHNKYQLWIGVFIGLLSGFSQYLRWREFNWASHQKKFWKHTGIALAVTALLTGLALIWIEARAWQYMLLLFTGIFAVVTNLDYLISFARGNVKLAGSALSHIGFGIMIVGILASGLNKHHISTNPFAQRGLLEEERLGTNILLFKNMPMFMSGYQVTYAGDRFEGNNRIFDIHFQEMNAQGDVRREFTLQPTALYDNKVTKVAAYNPSTKHYLHKDIFTHLASIPLVEADVKMAREQEDSLKYRPITISAEVPDVLIDTLQVQGEPVARRYEVFLEEVLFEATHTSYQAQPEDYTLGARIRVEDTRRDTHYIAEPMMALRRNNLLYTYPVHIQEIATKIRLTDDIFEQILKPEEELPYVTYELLNGERFEVGPYQLHFKGFDREPGHPAYEAEKDDIAIGAILEVTAPGLDSAVQAIPVYLIRGNRPYNFKDELLELGLHFRFAGLNPEKETIAIQVAYNPLPTNLKVEAAYAPRTDFVVLETIVFPGINLFWLGSVMMMIGLTFSMYFRIQTKRARA